MSALLRPAVSAASTELRWLYVDFNSYFASVEQEVEPRLRGKPVAVLPVDTDFTCAIAASYEAKAFGVRTGTSVRDAKRMCPGLICVIARHDLYVQYHQRILKEIERHIPVTAVCSIDEVASRLMDNETSEIMVERIAMAIKQGLARNVGDFVRCSIGVASNRYLAKVATDLQKPDGFVILRAADLPGRLLPLALNDLPGVGRGMMRRLQAGGVHTMQDLWALSPTRMHDLWGNVWGPRMWALLRGEDLPEIETQRRSIGHSHVMSPEFRDPPKARHVARRLTAKASSRLRRMGYYASALSFSARFENGDRIKDAEVCWRARDSLTFLTLLERIWARHAIETCNKRIKQVGVTLYNLKAEDELEADLFDLPPAADTKPNFQAKAESMSSALDSINRRFGRDTITIGSIPQHARAFSGTKIAFTRIPDVEEFSE